MGWGIASFGGALNALTGATSAAKQNQKYALQSGAINNAYQKEFAQNAHQWEVEDLKKAGLNPVLSANSGASASGGGVGSGSIAQSGINPIETAIGVWNGFEQAQNTGADTRRKNAETDNLEADTLLKQYQQLTEIAKKGATEADRKLAEAKAKEVLTLIDAKLDNIEMDTKLKRKTKEKMTTKKGGKGSIGVDAGFLGRIGIGGDFGLEN